MTPTKTKAVKPPLTLTLVIPVYNEIKGIHRTIQELDAARSQFPEGTKILFVQDCSTDGTEEWLDQNLPEWAELLHHSRNRGYGASIKTGIQHTDTDLIAISDADGTYPLKKIPALYNAITSGSRMAVGARPVYQQPLERRLAKVFLNKFASYLSGSTIPDINSGLRVFYREDALRYASMLPNQFSLTSTITMLLACDGESIFYTPIKYGKRIGHSKIRPLHDLGTFTMLILRLSMAFNPLKVFGPLSLVMLLGSAFLLILRLINPEPQGLATTIVLFVAGIQLLATGLLADLVNRRGSKF